MKNRLRPLMFVGTCSDAGKSVVNTAFCRILKQKGYNPAPFKAQNMSLNSYSTREGGEMGRAQVVQAEACRIEPHTDMNPVLLKPTHDQSSQVILNGKVIGNMSARDYFGDNNSRESLFEEVKLAYDRLASSYNPIVLEGAGSISELNLKERDITNMRMAQYAGACTYLIADIDRGGVFGSIYGTIALLDPEERALIKGIIINKFRGDISLFEDGKRILEDLTGKPVVGVIPWFRDIKIEEEDSVALDMKRNHFREGKINVAIILLKRMSNFTDFDVLEMDPRFNPYYTNSIDEIKKADIILLPGSKNTLADLQYLKATGVADTIVEQYKKSKKVIGICGGYQMMGERIEDPDGIEGPAFSTSGLGLLPVNTILHKDKVTLQRSFFFMPSGEKVVCKGYEIHNGKTTLSLAGTSVENVCLLPDGTTDGCLVNEFCWGTYMHGILDNPVVLDYLAADYDTSVNSFDYISFKQGEYDKLAEWVCRHSDWELILSQLSIDN